MPKSPDIRFQKAKLSDTDHFEIDSDSLAVLSLIDKNKPLKQIFQESNLRADVFKQIIRNLYNLNLIKRAEDEIRYLDGAYLQRMKEVLIDLLGPLGEVLLADAAAQLALDFPSIPLTQIEEYVVTIANEIPGEKQQISFKKTMLEMIGTIK